MTIAELHAYEQLLPHCGARIDHRPQILPYMDTQLFNLQRKVLQYKEVLQQTLIYRERWKENLKQEIKDQLTYLAQESGLEGTVEEKGELENLEAVSFSLGTVRSGMFQQVNDDFQRDLVKYKGALVYQQLFNGKVIVLIQYPFIEGYSEPKPPKTIAIYRPAELQPPFFVRHMETFITEITHWEDYDDDEPAQRIGFQMNFAGAGEEKED